MKISIAESGTHFATQDGTPFFWLADTAWNAALHSDTDDWRRYLETRAQQKFTVIQFVSTPWRGCRNPIHGPLFSENADGVSFDEHAWEKMEEWLGLIVEYGMVPAPVMIWDNNPDEDFFKFRDETCIQTGRRMLERWHTYGPLWILAGDGDYRSSGQDTRWKRIGRAVFDGYPDALATMHPCGESWINDHYRDEPWFSFAGIQSGHGSSDYDLRFLVNGPYTYRWKDIPKPFINLEPNYEFARSYQDDRLHFGGFHVRRAAWWSILGAPTAGVTYGSNPIWIWPRSKFSQAEGHGSNWAAAHWSTGLETAGIAGMTTMVEILDTLPWTELRPADELLHEQPGWDRPENYIKVAATADRSTVVAYLPRQERVRFSSGLVGCDCSAAWVDPRTGEQIVCELDGDGRCTEAHAPNGLDWLLVLRRN